MMEMLGSLLLFFKKGGLFMYPIALMLAVGVAIAVERWFYLQNAQIRNSALWKRCTPLIRDRNFDGVLDEASRSNAVLASILTFGIARARSARSREAVEIAMDESMMEVLPKLEKRTHYLGVFANVATLLGLLGTVVGLIHAFQAVAGVSPAEKSAILSAAISEAMNCTAFGLLTAIPLMLIHSWLQSKTTEIEDSLEMASVKFLNALTEAPAAPATPARPATAAPARS